MELTAGQGSPQLIEPLYRRRRRILAVVVIVVVVIGLLVSIFTQQETGSPPKPQEIAAQAQPSDGQVLPEEPQISQEQPSADITKVLFQFGQWAVSFIAVLSSIVELTGVNVRDLFGSRAAKTNVEEFPFYVYQDYDKLLAYLFPDPKTPLLPDRDIKYLPRISAEVDAALQGRGMVLIRGGSKTGKTREACEALRRWWYSGPTVLVVRSHVGLYPPFKIPENLPLRNLVIFFDDIDRYLGEASSLKRLDETLKFFQEICHNRGEVRVVATARQEEEFWEKLKFDSSLTPWNKFELIQLNPLSSEKALEVIAELSKTSGIVIEPELAKTLAEKNNGTFLNLALAFRGWLNQKIATITADEIKTFEGSLKNTWRRRYEELAAAHPRIKPVYAAIDFMQTRNISLRPELIAELAAEMALGRGAFSALGLIAKLQNWFDMSPMFNWYRDPKRRRKGWVVLAIAGMVAIYLSLYAFMLFVPGNTQSWFFDEIAVSLSLQIRCLSPLWLLLIPFTFYSSLNVLQNLTFRRTSKALEFLLDAEIPMRGTELRPYENQFEGNGDTNNWRTQNYTGEIREKFFSSGVSQRLANRYLSLAEQLRLTGEFGPARRFAALAKNILPNHPAPLFMLGKIELGEGNFQTAIELLGASQALYRRSSNAAYVQERLALGYFFIGEYQNAEQLADKALKAMPSSVAALWVLGLSQVKQGKISEGQKNCRKAEAINQPVPTEIQKALQTIDATQEEWLKSINLVISNPARQQTKNRLNTLKQGAALFLSIAVITVAFFVFIPYATTRLTEGSSGLRITNALLTFFPGSPTIIGQRGYAYIELGEYDKAIADYTEVIRIDPKAAYAYSQRAVAYRDLGEYDKSVANYTEAIRLDPEYAYAYSGRGFAYYKLGEDEKAIADYTA
ncbi:MAG: tetratricopeptide repeat protein, partial [Anaerolineales bacterium]|nr:tetratricopeptide repeat protein [Anaerolineales bacterium]